MISRSFSKNNTMFLIIMLCIFLPMLVFNFMTPLVADDFSYSFSWADSTRIDSVGDIFDSMAVHRHNTNGRVFTHGIVQFFLMLPKPIFNIVNAFNVVLLAYLFSRFLNKGRNLLIILGAFMVWNFMPVFGQVFLWLDGSCNYSWGISLFLLFLLPYCAGYMGNDQFPSIIYRLLFLPLAFVAGTYSENGSVCSLFIAICFLLFIVIREKKLPKLLTAGIAAEILGIIYLLTAPAMATRASEFSISALANNIQEIIISTKENLLFIYIIYAAALALCVLANADRRRIIMSVVFVLAGMASLASFSFAAYFAPRHFCFTVMFTVLASLILLSALMDLSKRELPVLLTAFMAVLFLFNFSLGALDITVVFKHSRERAEQISQAQAAGETSIALEAYVPSTKYSAPFKLDDLLDNPKIWPNNSFAMYYGFDEVSGFLPD